ncbi:hypothetical protein TL16_g09980 [Triparma laevis f. inornata]|uniref:Cyclic nucleotide-binding domain-containing protein n=1 Tax=Triparma laevis f. inornata TaxID=1714386 RepID=A0A9W7EPA8_9STRA|nr:hypothetical protein TL16_g09980 [Triparma laevis f. inornata]
MNVGHRASSALKSLGGSFHRSSSQGAASPNNETYLPSNDVQPKNNISHVERADTKTNALRAAIMQTQLTDHGAGAIEFKRGSIVPKEELEKANQSFKAQALSKSAAAKKNGTGSYRAGGRRGSASGGLIPTAMELGQNENVQGDTASSLRTEQLKAQMPRFSTAKAQSFTESIVASFRGRGGRKGRESNQGNKVKPVEGGPGELVSVPEDKVVERSIGKSQTKLLALELARNKRMTENGELGPVQRNRRTTMQKIKKEIAEFHRAKKGCFNIFPICHPANPKRMHWDLLLAVVLVWNLIEIPFQVCFNVEAECMSGYDYFGLSQDIFFICDVIVNFHTGFIDDGKYNDNPRAVAHYYIHHGFWLDFVTSIPYSRVLNLVAGGFCPPEVEEGAGQDGSDLAVIPRLLRVFRIFKLVKLFRLVKLMNVISTWEDEAGIGFSRVLRMTTLFFQMLFLSHIAGCLFAYIALDAKENNGDVWTDDSWVVRYANSSMDEEIEISMFRLYTVSFYWAITTLTTVGYGDINPFTTEELILTVIVQFVGTLVFGYVMASITSVVSTEDMTAMLIKKKIGELNEYMTHRDLAEPLKMRIRLHYEYQWKRTTIYDEEEILSSLPPFLRMDVACSMNLDLVKNVPVLAALGDDCMAMLVTKLKPMQLIPGEMVVKKGTVGHEMYFITEGILDVYIGDDDDFPKVSLRVGSYFGEPAILASTPVKRSASIEARVFSQLESLSKQDFLAVADLFPDIMKMLAEVQTLTGSDAVAKEKKEQTKSIQKTEKNSERILDQLENIMKRLDAIEGKG